ncbi:VOC family protein [Sporosarcina sp. ANT_H38]|uniref:VOC family protein n=1 Tax=Sporosarcina sp. ANT_H38 TaxID=2597358 RepID=UPI0011F0F514|nr:VOC family protein [Sporosarcina sp. ANT_H38]KAA0955769.1 VOC family protein [Sporosarcina sp. ANT_H38]
MKGAIIPYLTFYGDGKEAVEFYTNLSGLERVGVQKYSDANFPHPPEAADYLLHCHLKKGDFQIMLADSADKPSENNKHGVTLLIDCESEEEIERLYDRLLEEGKVLMELQDMFWGAKYGKVIDKFGFTWDLNFEKKG